MLKTNPWNDTLTSLPIITSPEQNKTQSQFPRTGLNATKSGFSFKAGEEEDSPMKTLRST